MEALTPAERRGALLVALLLALGAAHDLWRAWRPLPVRDPHDHAAVGSADDHGWPDPGVPGRAVLDTSRDPADPGRQASKVDLNRATARELDALPGVGPVLAARIIADREQRGGFRRVDELMAVRGIGPRLYARLLPLVAVGPHPDPPRSGTKEWPTGGGRQIGRNEP